MTKKGGATIPLFHCVFHDGSLTHFLHDFDPSLYKQLANLYAVCVADNSIGFKRIIGGYFIKTSFDHKDPEFQSAAKTAAHSMNAIAPLLNSTTTILPSKLTIAGDAPLSEHEMLSIIFRQYIKHHEVGRA